MKKINQSLFDADQHNKCKDERSTGYCNRNQFTVGELAIMNYDQSK